MSIQSVKKSQKESQIFKLVAQLFTQITLDDSRLQGIMVNRVKLSDDKGVAMVFFYSPGGMQEFQEKLPFIILYKASLRRALAKSIHSRYTPELVFKFDEQFEKQQKIENLLEKIKGDDSSSSSH